LRLVLSNPFVLDSHPRDCDARCTRSRCYEKSKQDVPEFPSSGFPSRVSSKGGSMQLPELGKG